MRLTAEELERASKIGAQMTNRVEEALAKLKSARGYPSPACPTPLVSVSSREWNALLAVVEAANREQQLEAEWTCVMDRLTGAAFQVEIKRLEDAIVEERENLPKALSALAISVLGKEG